MKKSVKKTFSLFAIVGMLFNYFAPTIVFATSYMDGSTITIDGNPTINSSNFEYSNGDVTITKNGISVNTTTFTVAQNDEIIINMLPDAEYSAQLHNNNSDYNVQLDNNTYRFTIGNVTSNALSFTPSFITINSNVPMPNEGGGDGAPMVEAMKFDFKINGKSFTNVTIGDTLTVSDDFNMDSLEEFYVTKIFIEHDDPADNELYEYAAGEYSLELRDSLGRTIFDSHLTKTSDNYALLRVEAHSGDILADDIADGKTLEDYFGFYITNMSFIKAAFKGVEVSTSVMPDNYDFTLWNGADLTGTSESNPGIVTSYYGEDTIRFNSKTTGSVSRIDLADDSVPSSAVSINNTTGEVTILSNFYNQITLKITLSDGTIGYIKVNRIGIYIGDLNAGNDTFYHGAFAMVEGNMNVDIDNNRIAAVFYHEDTTTYEDYDLIANITYNDGNTKTVIARGVGDNHNSSGNITGSNYIIWASDKDGMPVSVSVTAVKKGTLNNESTTFDGVEFGAGLGVTWTNNRGGI